MPVHEIDLLGCPPLPPHQFLRRWGLINATCNFVGMFDFMVFLWVSGLATTAQLATIVLHLFIALPLVPATIGSLGAPRMLRFFRALKRINEGETLPETEAHWAKRFYFVAPRLVAMVAFTAWIIVNAALLAMNLHWLHLTFDHAGTIALIGIATAGPLAAVTTFFASDVHVRNQAARLFPDGRLSTAPGRSVPIPVKGALVLLFGAILPQIGMGTVLAEGAAILVNSPGKSSLADFNQLVTYMTIGNIGVLLLLMALMERGTALPVLRVSKAMRLAEEGDMDARVVVESNDPVGYLAERFNQMLEGIREREFLRQAFGRYVSAEVADEVLGGKLELGGERRYVTLMFTDIRDFTTMSEKMAPRDLVDLLNRYFARMVSCVIEEGGMVNKFIGDGIMAVFGAPVVRDDHAHRAVSAGMRMLEELEQFNRDQREHGSPELRIGIGIATGEVVVGNVGSEDKTEYTAIGDTVNTASRIEGLTKDAGVPFLLDEATYQLVKDRFPCESQGPKKVKGKAEPVAVYTPSPARVS